MGKGVSIKWLSGEKTEEIEVESVQCDSRSVRRGDCFVALAGTAMDGHDYIEEAVRRGASSVIVEKVVSFVPPVATLLVPDTKKVFGFLCAAINGFPSRKLNIVAVTGTNGKSSTAFMIRDFLSALGSPTGLIGTVRNVLPGRETIATHTTPPAMEIQSMLKEIVDAGWKFAVMETSSHALDQNRLAGCEFRISVFTNITQDHLDYHKTMENYFESKLKLTELIRPDIGSIVYNCDDSILDGEFSGKHYANIFSFGIVNSANVRASDVIASFDSTRFILSEDTRVIDKVTIPFSGVSNVYNFLAAAATLKTLGYGWDGIISNINKLKAVPGRFEKVYFPSAHVYVDYAHTPDALDRLLVWANSIKRKRIITVFGCGGDRDKTKRPIMGKIASEKSDAVIVTSDNPRTENPDKIIGDILEGVAPRDNCIVIRDRREAIRRALSLLMEDDILLIAGKGHEDYQIFGKEKIHFDDKEVVKEWVEESLHGGETGSSIYGNI